MEWIQDELANVPESDMTETMVMRATVKVLAENYTPLGDDAQSNACLQYAIDHFLG